MLPNHMLQYNHELELSHDWAGAAKNCQPLHCYCCHFHSNSGSESHVFESHFPLPLFVPQLLIWCDDKVDRYFWPRKRRVARPCFASREEWKIYEKVCRFEDILSLDYSWHGLDLPCVRERSVDPTFWFHCQVCHLQIGPLFDDLNQIFPRTDPVNHEPTEGEDCYSGGLKFQSPPRPIQWLSPELVQSQAFLKNRTLAL